MNEYIDVRGIHPTYIRGLIAISLVGANRDITVEQAKMLIRWDSASGQLVYSV